MKDEKAYKQKLDYNNRYNKASYKAYTFRLNKIADADLIDTLDQLDTVKFIRNALRDYRAKHTLSQNLRSRKSKRIGMPYEVYSIDADGLRIFIGSADDLEQAKNLRDASYMRDSNINECIIIKRYMNKYGTVVGMKVKV